MRVIKATSKRGDRPENEDTYGYTDNAFWVIDGATDLFNLGLFEGDDVAFYVRKLSSEIKKNYNRNDSLSKIVRVSIININNKYNINIHSIDIYKYPSFAIAIARYLENKMEFMVLGDCTFMIKTKKGIQEITDKRISDFTDLNRKGIMKLKEEGAYNADNELKLFQNTRSLMNKNNGYWIGSVDPKSLEHALTGEIVLDEDSQIIVCTDGFFEIFGLFNLAKIDAKIFDKDVLNMLEKQLRKKQDKDKNRLITRTRSKDDLTYILVR